MKMKSAVRCAVFIPFIYITLTLVLLLFWTDAATHCMLMPYLFRRIL